MIECNVCLQERPESEFYNITVGIEGEKTYFSSTVDEICKDCLSVDDIQIIQRTGHVGYEIKNKSLYIERRQANWYKHVLGVPQQSMVELGEVAEILKERKILTLGCENHRDNLKIVRDFLKIRIKDGIIPDFFQIPISLSGSGYVQAMSREDLERVIKYASQGKFKASNTHEVSFEKLLNLKEKGWVVFLDEDQNQWLEQDALKVKFFVNSFSGKTPCRKCGEVKTFKEFRYTGKDKSILTFDCLECESKRAAAKYAGYTKEEKDDFLQKVKLWRLNNPEKRKEYTKNPANRAARNVRKRLKSFMKTHDNNFNQGIGCTRIELVRHLESLFKPGMSWDNYGSGENGDHVGSWHIDHKIPISKFKGEHPNHYTNLQPLWAQENMSKGNKVLDKEVS
tara:strand:+ start:1050 stop:2237 length:1188 start_codon:yes stop_codon:yes gene_type:complete